MAISLGTGFSIGSKDLIYDKFVLTKDEISFFGLSNDLDFSEYALSVKFIFTPFEASYASADFFRIEVASCENA